jgi:hypothetical protein
MYCCPMWQNRKTERCGRRSEVKPAFEGSVSWVRVVIIGYVG